MIKHAELWSLAYSVFRKLSDYYSERMYEAAEKMGLETPAWFLLMAAYTFQPDPISVGRLRVRSPYTAPELYRSRIEILSKGGWLKSSSLGGYFMTQAGIEATHSIMAALYDGLSVMPALDPVEMEALVHAVGRLVEACMIYGPHISKWSLIYSRRMDIASVGDLAGKLDHYLTDLNAYRDDVHLAAWRDHDVSGHTWDVFTSVWREGPITIDKIRVDLSRRGWNREATLEAVQKLIDHNWIEGGPEHSVTERGRQVREQAESLTDEYFYAPWSCAEPQDLQTMSDLLSELAGKIGVEKLGS